MIYSFSSVSSSLVVYVEEPSLTGIKVTGRRFVVAAAEERGEKES